MYVSMYSRTKSDNWIDGGLRAFVWHHRDLHVINELGPNNCASR